MQIAKNKYYCMHYLGAIRMQRENPHALVKGVMRVFLKRIWVLYHEISF
jgi:hypothetical protein